MNRLPHNEVVILLVEDDDIDAIAVQRAFRNQKIANPVLRAQDGMEALAMLRGTDGHERITQPFMILLDLNMPRLNGIEFLEELRDDQELHKSIVFVLTTSNDDRDKLAAYKNHIAGYLLKSNVGVDFVNLVNMLDHFWRYVEFPPENQ